MPDQNRRRFIRDPFTIFPVCPCHILGILPHFYVEILYTQLQLVPWFKLQLLWLGFWHPPQLMPIPWTSLYVLPSGKWRPWQNRYTALWLPAIPWDSLGILYANHSKYLRIPKHKYSIPFQNSVAAHKLPLPYMLIVPYSAWLSPSHLLFLREGLKI